jgi:DNA-binding HxlR family transcriptional regulator
LSLEQPIGADFVQITIKVLGGKWKLLILWHLKDEAKRFSELKRLIPNIAEKMLMQQLRELEKDRIIDRNVRSTVPLQVEYSFTAYGRTLIPAIEPLCDWGKAHLEHLENRNNNNL